MFSGKKILQRGGLGLMLGLCVQGCLRSQGKRKDSAAVQEIDGQISAPVNLASMTTLTTSEALNKLSLKILGKPASLSLREKPEIFAAPVSEALGMAFDEMSSPEGGNADEFADWIVAILRDRWKIQVVRNDAVNEWATWRMTPTPEVMTFNKKYLTRRPDRIFYDPSNPGIFGGDGFDLPPSNFDIPGDAGYALYELEPLLYGAYLVLYDKPFSGVVTGSETVRSGALQEFAGNFVEESPQLQTDGKSVPHWSGQWQHYERRTNKGQPWGGGILSTIGFLRTYVRERTWAARGIYDAMLCREVVYAPVPPTSVKLERIGDSNPLGTGQTCKGCHNMLDGLANLRMEYGVHAVPNWLPPNQAFYPTRYDRLFDVSQPSGLEQFNAQHGATVQEWPMKHYLLKSSGTYAPVESIASLGEVLAEEPDFHSCQVTAFVDALVHTNNSDVRARLIEGALTAYFNANRSMKAAIKSIISSEVFYERYF